MNRQIISTIIILALSINIFACTSQPVSASNKSTTKTITATQNNTKLTKGIKNLLEKDVIKSLMGNKTIHEVFQNAINEEQLKELEEYLKKTFNDINLSVENFATDEATYEWIANTVTAVLKMALTNGLIKQKDIDQLNQSVGLLGINKINIDFSKDNYTKEDTEKIALDFVAMLDKVLNPFIMKLAGIDLTDPKFFRDLLKQITSLK